MIFSRKTGTGAILNMEPEGDRSQRQPSRFSIAGDMPNAPGSSLTRHFRLADVPKLVRDVSADNHCSAFEADPDGVAAEQFRLMRRRLINSLPGGGIALLTSPGSGDGKSLNAHNLSWALAEAGHTTLLLEMDLRRPMQSKYFHSSLAPSVSSVLSAEYSADSALRRVGDVPLYFLGQEAPAREPSALLRSESLRDLLKWARDNFDWVVLDAPPILPVADVEELLPVTDVVILVVRLRVTPRAMVERTTQRLGKRLDYVILNDVVLSDAYGYGYQY